jgi:hypothetical protein
MPSPAACTRNGGRERAVPITQLVSFCVKALNVSFWPNPEVRLDRLPDDTPIQLLTPYPYEGTPRKWPNNAFNAGLSIVRNHWTGIVRTGASGAAPVSASEKNRSRKVNERFEPKSSSAIQYRVSR